MDKVAEAAADANIHRCTNLWHPSAAEAEYLPLDMALPAEANITPPVARILTPGNYSTGPMAASEGEPSGPNSHEPPCEPDRTPILVGRPIESPTAPGSLQRVEVYDRTRLLTMKDSAVQEPCGLTWPDPWQASAEQEPGVSRYTLQVAAGILPQMHVLANDGFIDDEFDGMSYMMGCHTGDSPRCFAGSCKSVW